MPRAFLEAVQQVEDLGLDGDVQRPSLAHRQSRAAVGRKGLSRSSPAGASRH